MQLVVTGTHLSPEFGLTYRIIEEDGFFISEKVEILLSGDSNVAVSTSIGLGVIKFASVFEELRPDILLLLGDRFESLAAATAAMVARIPIAHIGGGQGTEGAIDEAIRHSLTKMSHLHFASIDQYRDRIVQLGEQPDRVFVTGTPSVDGISEMQTHDPSELRSKLGLDPSKPVCLVVYHPVTLEDFTAGWQMDKLLSALASFDGSCVFIMPNADTGGRAIFQKIEEFIESRHDCRAFTNLDRDLYLNLMTLAKVMVGNSSSGIVEAPSFSLPVVNIGDRQRGRMRAGNVIDCGYQEDSIADAIRKALEPSFKESLANLRNPHGDGRSSPRIVDILESADLGEELLKKRFFDVKVPQVAD